MAKKGDTKIVRNIKYIWTGTRWKTTPGGGKPTTQTRKGQVRRIMSRGTGTTPGANPERHDAYRTGNRKTERQIAAEEKAKSTKPTKPTKPIKPTKPTKPTPTPKPTNRGAGNGAPGASSAVTRPQAEKKKVRGGNNKAGRTSRLEDALASVKKYSFKKKK